MALARLHDKLYKRVLHIQLLFFVILILFDPVTRKLTSLIASGLINVAIYPIINS